MPQVGEKVMVPQGRAEVLSRNIFDRHLKVRLENGEDVEVPVGEVKPLAGDRPSPPDPDEEAGEEPEGKRPEGKRAEGRISEDRGREERRKDEKSPPREKPG